MNNENQTSSDDLEHLKSEAEQNRQRLAEDVDALGAKVSVDNLKKEAKEVVSDMGRDAKAAVSDMGRKAVNEVQSVAQEAVTRTQRFSESLSQAVRENPVPAALAVASLGWLFYCAATRSRSDYSSRAARYSSHADQHFRKPKEVLRSTRQKLEEATSEVKQHTREAAEHAQARAHELSARAHELREQAGRQAREAGRWVEHTYQENPLLFGAATIGAGVALGLALPRTRVENQLLGEKRDQLIEQVKEKAETKAKEMERKVASKAEDYAQPRNGGSGSRSSNPTSPGGGTSRQLRAKR